MSSVGGSVFTMNMLQNRGALVSDSQPTGNTGQTSNKVIDSASAKSQNVYQAVAQKASPSEHVYQVHLHRQNLQKGHLIRLQEKVQKGTGTGLAGADFK